jgi:hypothetical protein
MNPDFRDCYIYIYMYICMYVCIQVWDVRLGFKLLRWVPSLDQVIHFVFPSVILKNG